MLREEDAAAVVVRVLPRWGMRGEGEGGGVSVRARREGRVRERGGWMGEAAVVPMGTRPIGDPELFCSQFVFLPTALYVLQALNWSKVVH